MPEEDLKDICEICHEEIVVGVPQIRVVADAMVSSGPAEYASLIENRVLVFAVFHSSCLQETAEDHSLDEVPYIWEARSLLDATNISAKAQNRDRAPMRVKHLKVIQGGIR